jgi:hypothetical protein
MRERAPSSAGLLSFVLSNSERALCRHDRVATAATTRLVLGRGPTAQPSATFHSDGDTVIVLWDGHGTATDGQPYEDSYAWFMECDGSGDRRHRALRQHLVQRALDPTQPLERLSGLTRPDP